MVIRADPGTENVNVKQIQYALLGNQGNNYRTAYIEGSSTSNQRIECFWSNLRKQLLEFWLCFFRRLQDNGDYLGDFMDKNAMRFAFMRIIQVSDVP